MAHFFGQEGTVATSPTSMQLERNFVSVCRWQWCSASFDSADLLADHVLKEHIAKAKPMKRRDVDVHLRAQDGISFEDSMPFNLDIEDDKDAVRVALNLPPHLSSPATPSSHSSSSSDSHQVAESLAILSPLTPQHASSSRPRLSIRTPDASPQPQRFRSLTENASPSRTPDFTLGGSGHSPTTQERLTDILGRRRRSPMNQSAGSSHGSSEPVTNNGLRSSNLALGEVGRTNGISSTPSGKQRSSMTPTASHIQSSSRNASTASQRGPAVSRKVTLQSVSTPLTNVLRHRRDKSNEAQMNNAMGPDESQPASSVTESETQTTLSSSSQSGNLGEHSYAPPCTSNGLRIISLAEGRGPSPPPELPYDSRPIMKMDIHSDGGCAHTTPPNLDMRPQMRLRRFRSGRITLDTLNNTPKRPSKKTTSSSKLPSPPNPSVTVERSMFLNGPDDFLDSQLGTTFDILSQQADPGLDSQWHLQTQAPYDFDAHPVQSQWKAFGDSQ